MPANSTRPAPPLTNETKAKPSRMSGGQRPREEEGEPTKGGSQMDTWEYWIEAGKSLTEANKEVTVGGRVYTKQECFVKAVEIDPTQSVPWCEVGYLPFKDDSVTISGTTYSSQDVFSHALEINPSYSRAWIGCSSFMPTGQSVTVWGTAYTPLECLNKAIAIDSNNADAWYYLGFRAFHEGKGTVTVGGGTTTTYSEKECYLKALSIDPTHVRALSNFGTCFSKNETVTFNGSSYSKTELFVKCLSIDPSFPIAWFNLGACLRAVETANVSGTIYTKQDCYLKANQLDPTDKGAWHELSALMSTGKHDCYRKDAVLEA